MRDKELKRCHIIRMDVGGKITFKQASRMRNISARRIKQLKASSQNNGDEAFTHCNKNKACLKRINDSFRNQIIALIKKQPLKAR